MRGRLLSRVARLPRFARTANSSRDSWPEPDETGWAPEVGESHYVVCQGLVKIYKIVDLETVALQGLDLEVRRGELLAIVGNSGSGKSTLLNILGGLDRPSAGRVFVGRQNLLELSDDELARYRREQVGFVWQQSSRNLIPYLTALENVQLPMLISGGAQKRGASWARELLTAVGLGERMQHRTAELSGGEQQRVAIAVAMVNRPQLVLADEPTGEVDSDTAAAIYSLFRWINKEFGTTVIIVSHDRNVASEVDRVVHVRDGKVSTEVKRRVDEQAGEERKEHLEELVVLDSAGRLQIPADLVEKFGLRGRVRVEARDGQLVILPAQDGVVQGGVSEDETGVMKP
ncbi:MAG: ABC transporter ATP-binding protein [Chloroflexi bacterium]|nr:ABC transporter ATP-binding protein [Chloroflexota bacterium]